jgi:putative protease
MASKRPEVLAPAGDRASLEAAVRAGADAVYFGLQAFNARARASNFDETELQETMAYLRRHGVRGYVTLNTLVFDRELPKMEEALRTCAAAGVDAVIVQDLGVMRMAREIAPTLHVHASTQMTCTDAGACDFAARMGASRVILARELSVADIEDITAHTHVPVEVFVHGALGSSYSGQCLTSEAFGGRSANRGACAQACRLPYDLVVDGQDVPMGDREFLLSPEDLEASALVPELLRAGVVSLKIEGRLKGPAYVAATTELYRKAAIACLDAASPGPSEHDRRAALAAYTRGSGPGFLQGPDHQRIVEGLSCDHRGLPVGTVLRAQREGGKLWVYIQGDEPIEKGDGLLLERKTSPSGELVPETGGRVWDVVASAAGEQRVWFGPDKPQFPHIAGQRVFRSNDPRSAAETLSRIERTPHRVELRMGIRGEYDGPFELWAESERGHGASVTSTAVITRSQEPRKDDVLRDKLSGLGDTAFVLGSLDIALPDHAFVPPSALKKARRDLVAALGEAPRAHEITSCTAASVLASIPAPTGAALPPGIFVLCRNIEQARAAHLAGADGVYLDFLELTGTGDAVRELRKMGASCIGVAPPRIRKPGEDKIDRYLASLAPDAVLIRGLGALGALGSMAQTTSSPGPLRIADFSLNVANQITARTVLAEGAQAFVPSFDLDAAQLFELLADRQLAARAEVVIHHPMPLFHMEHCVIAATLSQGRDHRTCGRPCDRHVVSLRDRTGRLHPVEADVGCRNTVFHEKAQSAADHALGLKNRGVQRFRIELVRETAIDVTKLIQVYRSLVTEVAPLSQVWAELRAEGGYGVVRGSLRIVQ